MTQTQTFKPYHTAIAIKIEGITAQIITCTAHEDIHLQSEDERKQLDIHDGETFHLVASDSAPGYYYPVAFNEERHTWRCYCPSAKPCKHERDLKPYVINRYRKAKAAKAEQEPEDYQTWKRSLSREEFENRRSHMEMMEAAY